MLKLFRRLMPKEDRFFELFEQHSKILVDGAAAFQSMLEGGDSVPAHAAEVVRQENLADDVAREVQQALRRSFVTPFDRADIADLIQAMDDSIDEMNKVVKAVTLYELTTFDPIMQEMGVTIVDAAHLTAEAVPLMSEIGRNAQRLGELTEQIIAIENISDDLHDQGVKELLKAAGRSDPMAYIIGREIYGGLEDVVDRFEDVAKKISGIVIENV
ncbi:DUF47 domain-containing protein [Methylopila sp. M107]|uniref:DUF47 domain-containing protein n=1 Tax=Methylopila sp. M107 TaxID=1101190 RepID=UPI000377936E|nr:DUF47 domain-containing protein [Methylopila sp. M107]